VVEKRRLMLAKLIKSGNDGSYYAMSPFSLPLADGSVHAQSPKPFDSQLPPVSFNPVEAQRGHHESVADVTGAMNNVLDDARAEAARIIAEAQEQAAEIERQAYEKGVEEGRLSLSAEISEAIEPMREKFAATLDELTNLRESIAVYSEQELVRLAIEIAKKVVHRQVALDSEIALTLARVTLGRLHNRAIAKVHLHPEDYAYVVMHRERLGGGGSVELIEDKSITRGGCLVETEMGDIDARIEQQFAEIERGLMSL
jgi:flagellar biosynthesis/type III secretory pathway protein FliH